MNKISRLWSEWTEWTSSGQTGYFRNQLSGQNGQMPKGMSSCPLVKNGVLEPLEKNYIFRWVDW
jgi:hypothetical protein